MKTLEKKNKTEEFYIF